MSFSERGGMKARRETIQLNSMDGQLRIALYNHCHDHFVDNWYDRGQLGGKAHRAARIVWTDDYSDLFRLVKLDWSDVGKTLIPEWLVPRQTGETKDD